MRLLGSIALLHALPPIIHPVGIRAIAAAGRILPDIKIAPPFNSEGTPANAAGVTSIAPQSLPFTVTGYMLIAHCQVISGSKTFSVGGGWTIGDTSSDGNACWAWRYVDGTEALPTFSWSGSAQATAMVVQIGPNVKATGAIGNSGKASGVSTSVSLTGIVTSADNSRVLGIVCTQNSQIIPPAIGYTGEFQQANTQGSFIYQDQAVGAAAASASISTTITNAHWEAFLIEIQRA